MAITREGDEGEARRMRRRWRVGVIEKRGSRRTVKIPFSLERANNEMKKRKWSCSSRFLSSFNKNKTKRNKIKKNKIRENNLSIKYLFPGADVAGNRVISYIRRLEPRFLRAVWLVWRARAKSEKDLSLALYYLCVGPRGMVGSSGPLDCEESDVFDILRQIMWFILLLILFFFLATSGGPVRQNNPPQNTNHKDKNLPQWAF